MSKLVPQPHGGAINRFEPGESGNPKGQPPKVLTSVMKQLRSAGYERVTAAGVMEAYEILLGLDEDTLKESINDKEQPMILRIVGKSMLSKKGSDMLEKMLDRAHGKPLQRKEHSGELNINEYVIKRGDQDNPTEREVPTTDEADGREQC